MSRGEGAVAIPAWARAATLVLAVVLGVLQPVGPPTPPAHGRGTPASSTITNTAAGRWIGSGGDTTSPPGIGLSDTVVADSGDPVWIPAFETAWARPGETVYVQIRLVNLGNAVDTPAFAESVAAGWSAALQANSGGAPLADTRIPADETAVLWAGVRPPPAAADGATETAAFAAASVLAVPSTETAQIAVTVDATPPESPTLQAPAAAFATCETTVGFVWAASVDTASGVARYRLEVSTSSSFATIAVDTQVSDTAETVVLTVDSWWWRVTAIDAAGNTSPAAETRSLSVVSCTLASFGVTPNTTSITAGETVVLLIVARDNLGDTLVSFGGTASIGYAPAGTADTPSATGAFTAGVRYETVTITGAGAPTVVTVSSGSASGTAAITVLAGAAARFAVTAPAGATVGQAFTLSIAAVDTYGNTAVTFAESATIADSTGTITPSATGAFVAGLRSESVTISTGLAGDLIRVETGALSGTAVVTVSTALDADRLVEAWADTFTGGGATIVVRLVDATDSPVLSTGDTVRVTLLAGGSALSPNPYETTTVNGVATIPWGSASAADLTISVSVTLAGETTPVTYADIPLDVSPGAPMRTVASPWGGVVQAPMGLWPSSWRVVIRPVEATDMWMIQQADSRMPESMGLAGSETEAVREVFAVRSDGSRVSGALGGEVTIWLRYRDADADGIVDGTSIPVNTLRVYRLNESLNVWEPFPNSGLGADSWIRAIIDHFSFFGLLGSSGTSGLEGTVSYPNPFYPLEAGSTAGGVSQPGYVTIDTRRTNHAWMRVTIHSLSGAVVRRFENRVTTAGATGVDPTSGLVYWDGRNANGAAVASGLYFYVVESNLGRAVGKMTVIK